jgi:hypothetical protein
MGTTPTRNSHTCMVNYPIWSSAKEREYEVNSDDVYIIYDMKSREKTLTVLDNNFGELYCNYTTRTVEIVKANGLKFLITHVELVYDERRGYNPIIDGKITYNPNISSKYFDCNVGEDIVINSCYYFFNPPRNTEFHTVSNHLLIPKNDIIRAIY